MHYTTVPCVVWPMEGLLLFSFDVPKPPPLPPAPNFQSSGKAQGAFSSSCLVSPSWEGQDTRK